MEMVTLTKEMIEAVMTKGIGLLEAKYRLLGGEGRLSCGWKERLVGKRIPASDYNLLRDTVGMKRAAFERLRVAAQKGLDKGVAAKGRAGGAGTTHGEQTWQEVAGVTGSLPKRARRARRRAESPRSRNLPAQRRVTLNEGPLCNSNSFEEFMARQRDLFHDELVV
jgi:hypothetical protein